MQDRRVTAGALKPGDEVIIHATVDAVSHASVWLVADGGLLGRVIKIGGDVLVEKIGRSPSYAPASHDTYRRKP